MRRRRRNAATDGDQDDHDLVASACAGDDESFAELFRRHGADVVRSIERRTGSAALADDVTAAAFERAWRSLSDVRDRGVSFRPWLFRIAINELIDVQRAGARRTRREERHGFDPATGGVHLDPHAVADVGVAGIPPDDLRAAIATLSAGHQEVVTLRWFADFEPAEIATALGISKGAVAVRTHRAIAALRQALGVDDTEGVTR